MNGRNSWEKDYEYGFFAEKEIAGFFEQHGYSVEYAEDYAAFTPGLYYGPRIGILPRYDYESIEMAEVSCVYYIASDLKVSKSGKIKYVEIKRRGKFSRFNGEDIIYIDKKQFYDYCYLTDYGYDVSLMIYIDEFADKYIFTATIEKLYENIKYKTDKFVSFRKSVFDILRTS
ncbi:MAG: hypothetical protein PHU53_07265 [Thermoplasmata archaeon]|nr:hypothetical protein [Thermoplasmata archaeon]